MNKIITDPQGNQCWYKNNKLHREDGPAYIGKNGTRYWYKNNKLHRTDGPAVSRIDGIQYWFINDERCINGKSFQKAAKLTDEDMLAIVLKYGDVV
jgi:hypothetical protein